MPSRSGGERVGAAVLMLAAATGCANEQPPPGALPDARPPQVARFVPPRDTVIPGFDGSARIRFDEPVRLAADLGRRVTASPAYRYRFEIGFSEIEIRPEGGWREAAVYCFEIPAGISDLLNNRTDAPIPYCFSTGPPVRPTRVEGRVEDRVTGGPVPGARVLFLALPADTTPYTAEADGQGEFSLRSLPAGGYWAYGFQDRNRNLRLDRPLEPYDSVHFRLDEATGAPTLELALVEPDSTPPLLVSALAEDSVTVRLEFDDPLPTEQPVAEVAVRDSAGREVARRLLHVGDPSTLPPEARLRPVEPVVGEPAEEPPEAAAEPPPAEPLPPAEPRVEEPPAEPAAGATQAREPRPSTVVTILLEEALTPGPYTVEARGFANLRDLVGGGEATFVHPRGREGG